MGALCQLAQTCFLLANSLKSKNNIRNSAFSHRYISKWTSLLLSIIFITSGLPVHVYMSKSAHSSKLLPKTDSLCEAVYIGSHDLQLCKIRPRHSPEFSKSRHTLQSLIKKNC